MKKIHFIGIGGIGMSALAQICIARGKVVTGSDIRPSNLTEGLRARGAVISTSHASENLSPDTDIVVVSSVIKNDNPEILIAKEKAIPIVPRSELLRMIMKESTSSIAVTGTHGKTTTTALIAHIIEKSGQDPTVALGGEIDSIRGNAKHGSGDMFIAEVDESDGYFRNITSKYAAVTNIEREHMENYENWEDLINAYKSFLSKISPDGAFIFNGEDPAIKDISSSSGSMRRISFGMEAGCDVTCKDLVFDKSLEFDVIVKGENKGRITCPLIGRYNVMNLLTAIAVCTEAGIAMDHIVSGSRSFSGVKRRFEKVGIIKGISIVEDYAHHPTEIKAVINAAKRFSDGKVIVVFQPHRYSRTLDLADDLSKSFDEADVLILTDIYSADEEGAEKTSVEDLYKKVDCRKFDTIKIAGKHNVPQLIPDLAEADDIVLILGAGDIRDIGPEIVETIKNKK